MNRFARSIAFVLAGLLLLACTACKSKNEGKIVGKWKATAADFGLPGNDEVFYEFTADGRFSISGIGGQITGKYLLRSGNNVHMTGINPPIDGKTASDEKIEINGDTMILDGEGGKKLKLTRVK